MLSINLAPALERDFIWETNSSALELSWAEKASTKRSNLFEAFLAYNWHVFLTCNIEPLVNLFPSIKNAFASVRPKIYIYFSIRIYSFSILQTNFSKYLISDYLFYTMFHSNITFFKIFFNWFSSSHTTTTIHSLISFSRYVKKE